MANPTPSERVQTISETDLTAPDGPADELAPPAYGDIYGEIRNEKSGLGSTSARVTDDGRVNIRINQLNRRMSQIFTPALRQQAADDNETAPPPPYVPPSLGGEEGGSPPPSLNVVIQVVGSRGDVQPFVALGKILKSTYGHRVRLATHPNFKTFVQKHGLEFFSIGGDPSRLMAYMVKNPGLLPGFRSMLSGDVAQSRRDVAEIMQGCWRSCYKPADSSQSDNNLLKTESNSNDSTERPFVADCIIANPPSFAHIHCAEKLGVPLHIMFTMPYSPTQAFPHPLANIQSSNADPQLTNYMSYGMVDLLTWQGLGDIMNRFRAKCLGLEPVSLIWAPGMLQRLKVPHTYCWSPALIPKPEDWGSHISVSGYYMLPSTDYIPPPDLQTFLDGGAAPVYIGFGSIVLDDPNAMTELIFEAVRKTGQRVLLSKGWGGLGAEELSVPEGVFMLGNVPHDWLFKHVSCVVHHGGAGTTAAGITAGQPTLVVPFFGDQPFWASIVARAGAGPPAIHHKQLTADKLADAIEFCLRPESRQRAQALARKITAERGSDTGAQHFHQYLQVDRLRCLLAPSRPAVWRIKRTRVRLSALAACTLANANLLDINDLKLFRAQEYYTDEGPVDPISGGAAAFLGTATNAFMGFMDFPSETIKALRIPSSSRRKQSQTSVSARSRSSESSRLELPLGSNAAQATLNTQDDTSQCTLASSLSDRAPSSSRDDPLLTSDELQSQLSLKHTNDGRSRKKLSTGKDYDMLRPPTAHGSKGAGRIVKAIVQGPMDISMGMMKGAHNLPKAWGDDTVRPQQRVDDFKSGYQAVGKEFGYGFYDGITGLATQPWNGARKEGVTGFFKGVGKGVGGFVAKPTSALLGVPSYMMKGVHKEMQKVYTSNVQSHIAASRAAQGYEEWLQSSEADKEDVIARWKTVQKYMKRKHDPDEMVRDVLEAQRKQSTANTDIRSRSTTLATDDGPQPSWRPANPVSEVARNVVEPRRLTTPDPLCNGAIELEADPISPGRGSSSDNEWDMASDRALDDEEDEMFEQARRLSEERTVTTASGSASPAVKQPLSYDAGHLEGVTQSEYEGGQHGEKTSQERTEEEVVLEYIKKQSALELQHREKGNARAAATASTAGDQEDEDLRRALELSMREHENRGFEGSGQRFGSLIG